jgi:hypothetical protein
VEVDVIESTSWKNHVNVLSDGANVSDPALYEPAAIELESE